jgi:hypothetical protein
MVVGRSAAGAAVGVEKGEQMSYPTPLHVLHIFRFPRKEKAGVSAYAASLIIPENGTMMPSRCGGKWLINPLGILPCRIAERDWRDGRDG